MRTEKLSGISVMYRKTKKYIQEEETETNKELKHMHI